MILTRRNIRRTGAAVAIMAAAALAVTGCTEKLDGSGGCPITCTDQSVQLQTVTLDAVTLDSTVLGGLGRGTEHQMLLASRGDTLDTRVIIRFDTLPSTSKTSTSATAVPIAYLDSAMLTLQIDSAAINVGAPVTMSVYDVDDSLAVDDTSASAVAALFTPSRLVTSVQFDPGAVVDSLKIPLPKDFLLAKAQAHARLRLGLKATAMNKSVQFRVFASESGFGAKLRTRVSPDTSVAVLVMSPYSRTPVNNASIANSLGDFTIVVKGTPPPPPDVLAIGGLPGTRAYLRFNIPLSISDSSLVVAATLLLSQQPSTSPGASDSMLIQPLVVLAGGALSDPTRAAQVTAPLTVIALAPLNTSPGGFGPKEIQIGPVFRYWSAQTAEQLPRAIVLASVTEDYSAQQALFYSSSAAPALRPKLRISFTHRSRIGIP
ncbi:MAG: hypothetical protein ABI026_11095 [Gemmatimonadaceae bacterium]